MKRWGIIYSDGAAEDVLRIVDFTSQDSSINADAALHRLKERIATLSPFPERGRIVPELHWKGISSVREIIELPWRILYKIQVRDVVIVAIYDGRRHMNDVLLERLLR